MVSHTYSVLQHINIGIYCWTCWDMPTMPASNIHQDQPWRQPCLVITSSKTSANLSFGSSGGSMSFRCLQWLQWLQPGEELSHRVFGSLMISLSLCWNLCAHVHLIYLITSRKTQDGLKSKEISGCNTYISIWNRTGNPRTCRECLPFAAGPAETQHKSGKTPIKTWHSD